jgi:hypothetical protein
MNEAKQKMEWVIKSHYKQTNEGKNKKRMGD